MPWSGPMDRFCYNKIENSFVGFRWHVQFPDKILLCSIWSKEALFPILIISRIPETNNIWFSAVKDPWIVITV